MSTVLTFNNISPTYVLRRQSLDLPLMSIDECLEKALLLTPPTGPPLRPTSKPGHNFNAQFEHACASRGIAREFIYHVVAPHRYDVELRMEGTVIDRIGPYASHKDAKEEMCKKHLTTAQAMPDMKDLLAAPADIDAKRWINLVCGTSLCSRTCNLPGRRTNSLFIPRIHAKAPDPVSRVRV